MGNELLDGFQWILNSSQTSFNYLDSNSEIPEVPAPPSLAAALRSSLDPSSTTLSRSLICKLTNKLQLLTTDPTLYNLHINWNCKGFFAVTLPSLVHWLPLVGRCRDPVLANRIPTDQMKALHMQCHTWNISFALELWGAFWNFVPSNSESLVIWHKWNLRWPNNDFGRTGRLFDPHSPCTKFQGTKE